MSKPKVSISIVNYNRKGLLEACLASVMAQDYPEVEVVVVDNASADGSADMVRVKFPTVKLIVNETNLFFCAAHNQGIKATDGEYVLVLNNDVTIEKDFVSHMVRAMELDNKIGSVSGRILRTGGKRLDTTGLSLGRDRRPVERGYGDPDVGRYPEPGYVFGAGGVAPLYRRAMLKDVAHDGQYFDESFEAFYEDLDVAWRANRRGWKAYYTPKAVAYHARGGTAKTGKPPLGLFEGYDFAYLSPAMRARLVRNRWLTILKNDNLPEFLLNLPFILAYDIKVWLFLLIFSPGSIPDILRGAKALPDAWRQRKRTDET
ncbi:MAG: glycosyltransferase family 2 protein [Nitrospirae bacterium]|nr:glycosyltransferase family 2 protein [Nitrospirota bacterium]